MDIRFSFVTKVDNSALWPLTFLIRSFLRSHSNVGCIEIRRDGVAFTKHVFLSVGKINYDAYQLECRNGIIYYNGKKAPTFEKDALCLSIINALYALTPEHIVKL